MNDDAKQLMAGYKLDDRDLEDVIEDIVDRIILNGYINSTNDNTLLITVENSKASKELLDRVNSKIASYVNERQMAIDLLNQTTDITKDELEVANDYQVSFGKMATINYLQKN
jgi:hypothetical protein